MLNHIFTIIKTWCYKQNSYKFVQGFEDTVMVAYQCESDTNTKWLSHLIKMWKCCQQCFCHEFWQGHSDHTVIFPLTFEDTW